MVLYYLKDLSIIYGLCITIQQQHTQSISLATQRRTPHILAREWRDTRCEQRWQCNAREVKGSSSGTLTPSTSRHGGARGGALLTLRVTADVRRMRPVEGLIEQCLHEIGIRGGGTSGDHRFPGQVKSSNELDPHKPNKASRGLSGLGPFKRDMPNVP
jgi:hypothetical protein